MTRALDYAIRNQKTDSNGFVVDFVFPDDLQLILAIIGRMSVTTEQTDGAIILRYNNKLRQAEALRRRKPSEEQYKQMADARRQQESIYHGYQTVNGPTIQYHTHQMPNRQPSPYENGLTDWRIPQSAPTAQMLDGSHNGPFANNQSFASLLADSSRSASHKAAAEIASKLVFHNTLHTATDLPPIPDICVFQGDASQPQSPQDWEQHNSVAAEQQVDAYIVANQTLDPNAVSYTHL